MDARLGDVCSTTQLAHRVARLSTIPRPAGTLVGSMVTIGCGSHTTSMLSWRTNKLELLMRAGVGWQHDEVPPI